VWRRSLRCLRNPPFHRPSASPRTVDLDGSCLSLQLDWPKILSSLRGGIPLCPDEPASGNCDLDKKKTPTLQVEAEVDVLSAVRGTFATGLEFRRNGITLQIDVLRSDRQHKEAEFTHSKAVGLGKPTALPCPPYVPFSWTAGVGCRTSDEVDALHRCPHFRSAKWDG
jgi:hypothetical protein